MESLSNCSTKDFTIARKRNLRRLNIRERKCTYESSSTGSSGSDEETLTKKSKQSCRKKFIEKSSAVIQFDNNIIEDNNDEIKFSYSSNHCSFPAGSLDQGATATLQTETETDRDHQAIYQRSLKINKELIGNKDDKSYNGLACYKINYSAFTNIDKSSKLIQKGPIRAPGNIRVTCQWDYQPDICKDFKETGFCGFGNSCKFLHDRSDYKHGWEMEQTSKVGKTYEIDDSKYEIHSDNEKELPFKCLICRDSFKNPVVTKCVHYFCEKCALSHFKKSGRCYICNKQTNGVFNTAFKLISKLNKGQK